jgi:hypothetical protein
MLVAPDAVTASRVYLERSTPATDRDNDSGWLLAPVDGEIAVLHVVPVATLLEVRPDLRDILRLPTWSLVILEVDGRISTVIDGDDRDPRVVARDEAAAQTSEQ